MRDTLKGFLYNHQKILLVGSPGSGKTTLSKKLSDEFSLPLFHLDDEYWQESWRRPTMEAWIIHLEQILKKEMWLIEGNYFDSFELRLKHADFIIFLDAPMLICIHRILKRALSRMMGRIDSLPKNIVNQKKIRMRIPSFKFLKLILLYQWQVKPKMLELICVYKKPFVILKSDHMFYSLYLKDKK